MKKLGGKLLITVPDREQIIFIVNLQTFTDGPISVDGLDSVLEGDLVLTLAALVKDRRHRHPPGVRPDHHGGQHQAEHHRGHGDPRLVRPHTLTHLLS